MRKKMFVIGLLVFCLTATAFGGWLGKLFVHRSEALLTERSGQLCRSSNENFCERNYNCPPGKVAHAMIYNIKEEKGEKKVSGVSLVCSDPNLFTEPEFVGSAKDSFVGDPLNDYCPVGYLLAGGDFYTSDRSNITGARRVCRRYDPYEERVGPNLYGNGFDAMRNTCPEKFWVTGMKISYSRNKDHAGRLDTSLINIRFYCNEVQHWLVEPTDEELKKQFN